MISINIKDIRRSKIKTLAAGTYYAVIACVLWGAFNFSVKIPVLVLGVLATAFFIELGVLLASALNIAVKKESFKVPNKTTISNLFIISFLSVVAGLSFYLALNTTKVSITATIVSASPLVATAYGKVVYKEILSNQQWIAIALIITGLITISIL